LKIARELGLSPEILEQAESYLDREELKAYRLLMEVEAAQQHLAHKEAELAARTAQLDLKDQELEAQRRELEAETRRVQGEVQKLAQARIKAAEGEFKAILKRLEKGQESWGRLRQEFSERQAQLLKDLTPRADLTPAPLPSYQPGDKVFLPALGLTGEVLDSHPRDGRLEVRVRKVKLRISPQEVAPAGAAGGRAAPEVQAMPALPPESLPRLNVVGLRVDEALPLVDRLLDQAALHGQERVDIIHGVGTGKLKAAVWEHLKHHGLVKALHGDDNPGVTVVDLK
jgi:DNA mismatch repair protein MutS2